MRIGSRLRPGSLDGTVDVQQAEGHGGSDAGRLHSGQRREAVDGGAIRLLAADQVIAPEAGVGLDENGAVGLEAGFDAASFERATNEKSSSGEQPSDRATCATTSGLRGSLRWR